MNPATPAFGKTTAQRVALLMLGAAAFGGVVYGIKVRMGRSRGLPSAGPPRCERITSSGGTVAGIRYLERVTPGADPESPLPMVVVFHAKGATPSAYAGMFYKSVGKPIRLIVPEGPLGLGNGYEWFRLPGRTKDQDTLAEQMVDTGEQVGKFLADIVRCRPTIGRPVITGSSQGGSMTYLMATQYPYLARGAVALAGWLPRQLWAPHLPPTVGMHGVNDHTVPFEPTAEYAAAMQSQGANFTWRTYQAGHGISSAMSRDWRDAVKAML